MDEARSNLLEKTKSGADADRTGVVFPVIAAGAHFSLKRRVLAIGANFNRR
jgi:hypothetical protein